MYNLYNMYTVCGKDENKEKEDGIGPYHENFSKY